jgi:exopolysaccharide biosynthesis protein
MRAEATKVVSALVALSAAACATRTPQLRPPQPDSAYRAQLTRGVTHEYRWYGSGPFAVHTITIEPNACVGFRTAKAQERVVGREQTSAIAQRYAAANRVLTAINADFFSFEPPGISEGPQVSNGVLLKSEGHHREALEDRRLILQPVFAIKENGKPAVTFTRFAGTVRIGGQTMALAGVNVRARADSAFVYTSFWGTETAVDSGAIELVVRNGVVTAVDSVVQGVAIPDQGVVVVLKGAARAAASSVRPGTAVSWQGDLTPLPRARELVGGYPMLLQRGHAVHHDEAGLRTTFSDRRHPRAAIGTDGKGRIHIVAVDGRRPGYSDGMTLQELGDFLIAHGITDALNLDGGGSTTLVVGGRIVNRPTDANGERAVSNALLVIDQSQANGACNRKR